MEKSRQKKKSNVYLGRFVLIFLLAALLQQSLNELRTLNSTRYLYTAKRNSEGKLIYLVDGLDLGAEDFAYPGTYIEDEMIPYIDAALSGENVYSQDIVDTTWGHIFTACYPVRDNETNEIIGALCIEIDMESFYLFLEKINNIAFKAAVVAAFVIVLIIIFLYRFMQKQKQKDLAQQEKLENEMITLQNIHRAIGSEPQVNYHEEQMVRRLFLMVFLLIQMSYIKQMRICIVHFRKRKKPEMNCCWNMKSFLL